MNQEYTLIKASRLIDVQNSKVITDAAVLLKEAKIISKIENTENLKHTFFS